MTRKRKGKGGRVTPPRTRPRNWDDGSTQRPEHAPPPDLADMLPRFDHELTVLRDQEASAFVSLFANQSSDATAEDGEPDTPTAAAMLDFLTGFEPLPQVAIDTIAAIAVYGGPHAARARRALKRLPGSPSPAVAHIGAATVTSAYEVTEVFGEITEYLFSISYPDGSEAAIAVLIDHLLGGTIKDTVVTPAVSAFLDEIDQAPEVTAAPVSVARAAAAVDDAYAQIDQNPYFFSIDDDVTSLRPMVERILANHDRDPSFEPMHPSIEEQDRIRERFLAWAREEHPDVPGETLAWARLAITFSAEFGNGDPMRWGPNSIVTFMDWASRELSSPPEELAEIPDLLETFIEWTYGENGWGKHLLDDAMVAIDDSRSLLDNRVEPGLGSQVRDKLDQVLEGVDLGDPAAVLAAVRQIPPSFAEDTLVAPMGGSHPEPFDPSWLGVATDRASAVAELASASARALFDDEYVTLVRRLTADAARANPDLFARGRTDIWASGVVYAVAQLNEMIGNWSSPMSLDREELTSRLAGAPGTISAKAATVRGALGGQRLGLNPRYHHRVAQQGYLPFDDSTPTLAFDDDWYGDDGYDEDDDWDEPEVTRHDRLPDGSALELRAQMIGLPVWRLLRLPASATLADLHLVLQGAFGWLNYHLHEFTVGDHLFVEDLGSEFVQDGFRPASTEGDYRLDELVRIGESIKYVYDFGDYWQITIEVEDQVDPGGSDGIALLDGKGAAPPEDCGGVMGYRHLIEALGDRNHPEHEAMAEWADDFRPGTFDLIRTASSVASAALEIRRRR